MSDTQQVRFGFAVAPVDALGTSDRELYDEVIADCRLGQALGYESAWMLEHHFTDYFPTPSPLVFMAHVAALCPGLSLGACVLVTPWYDPLRLAEEIAMLSVLCRGELHLGLGRGTAKLEYDAFGIDMSEARDRFRESWEVVQLALKGAPFRYDGKFTRMLREVTVRPAANPDRVKFYGAIGSPSSATLMADYGLPPIAVSNFPLAQQQEILDNWAAQTARNGGATDVPKPIVLQAFIADTDAEARAIARQYIPQFFGLQADHYEVDADYWRDIKGYEQFSKYFANLKQMADPDQIEPWMDLQAIGTPATARKRLEAYIELGFNSFVINPATYGMPRAVRHTMLKRFAADVVPAFSGPATGQSAAE